MNNTFTLHATESNALLNSEILSLYSDKKYIFTEPNVPPPSFSFETEIYNPV